MPKRRVPQLGQLNPGDPLQIESLGRKGPTAPLRLGAEEIAQVSRTVRRVPEVVVKVSGGGRDAAAVRAHIGYIDRHGKLPIETDVVEQLQGRDSDRDLIQDWNLDALPTTPRAGSQSAAPSGRPKAVHNIVLSMPAKVPPEKLLAAAQEFAREHFALKHRYAMVLHTDTKHPHVHLVVKAEREDGSARLNIYKATLRQWREAFAQALRNHGIEANATPPALRGQPASRLKDSILRAQRRSQKDTNASNSSGSTFLKKKVGSVMAELARGDRAMLNRGLVTLKATRSAVLANWDAKAEALSKQGEETLANEVRAFARSLPAVATDAQRIAAASSIAIAGRTQPGSPDSNPRGDSARGGQAR